MRIIFMGTPEFAKASLQALVESGRHEILAVVTQPDRPKGRGHKLMMSAVKEYALSQNLPVLQPEKVKTESFLAQVKAYAPDLIVVAAFGQFLPKRLLELPKYGCINVHASLLPKYRGAAPIHYAILKGEKEAGVTIMQMDVGMDTGAMLAKVSTPIGPEMTQGELHDVLKEKGAALLLETIDGLAQGTVKAQAQNEAEATYATLITREMEKLQWQNTADALHNQIRAFNPWPGSYTLLPDGKRLKIWKSRVRTDVSGKAVPGTVLQADSKGFLVACGTGVLEIVECQPEGKRKMAATQFVNGNQVSAGVLLS
ncbi:MAG: methionyl-tRNA formyltransferase [Acidaminococcus sp.]|jgi:methionyl-tRNA formyltransferase|nr:methionyl-tRNA formyltransferase [Acidaminococcus sp.]MCI2100470.1 methionyl-tRNA formyltransferase [Acidaminococcus sp.]MCI2114791.1 methionyl-tRNA formyltransferase [Acidaminococcus sp.]MCI2116844.1 methionyl-tRNA formyltransferase [Acidaminococcus sp.]